MRWRHVMILMLFVTSFSLSAVYAETGKDVQYVKEYVSGNEFQVTYREGGSLYGTYIFLDVHFCSSGTYVSFGQSRKQTVLGNEQVNNWQDSGNWDVASVQGYTRLRYLSTSGAQDAVPVQILPDGGVQPLNGAFMKRLGKAKCK